MRGSGSRGDVNADGKTDIIYLYRRPADATFNFDHGGLLVALSDGSGNPSSWIGATTGFHWYRPDEPLGNPHKYPTLWRIGDIDGDRRTDIVNIWEERLTTVEL